MDLRYLLYCFGDPLFYDRPSDSDEEGDLFSWRGLDIPVDWHAAVRGDWCELSPAGATLGGPGWRIQVSADAGNAAHVLRTVDAYCVSNRIPFRFLRNSEMLRANNSKFAPPQESGTLIMIYPPNDTVLERALADLSETLAGQRGPGIRTGLRFGCAPLYVCYDTAAVPHPTTVDETLPGAPFAVPDGVRIPAALLPHLPAPGAFPYQVRGVLRLSTGGGIYRAIRPSDGEPVILKAARPLTGLDDAGDDAATRLDREWHTLRRLAGIPGVPAVCDRFTSGGTHFLVMRPLPGRPLRRWLADNYPLGRAEIFADDLAGYARRARHIIDDAERIITAIHRRGMVFGELHDRNLLVTDDGTVSLVGFESAVDLAAPRPPGPGPAGFAAPPDRTGVAVDEYALAALRLWIFLPLNQILALAPGKVARFAGVIEQHFPLPDGYADRVLARLRPSAGTSADTLLDKPEPDWGAVRRSIAAAILRSATPHRADRLFPGDIATFQAGGACFAYGAAGVLHALRAGGAGRYAEYEQWLIDAVRRDPPRNPGFYDGAHGVAYVLDSFGHHEIADRLIDSVAEQVAGSTALDLFGGLAGIGLNLLHFAVTRNDRVRRRAAVAIGTRLAGALASTLASTPALGAAGRVGLGYGWSGPALLFLRLYQATGEEVWLRCADRALGRDLAACVARPDGSLQVPDGERRTARYLATGSAGIAMVAGELAVYRPAGAAVAGLPALRRALLGDFTVQPGLLSGRAGLIAALAAVPRHAEEAERLHRALDRHLARLSWYSVPYQGNLAFPGNGLLRLSMDLATGSAGVLLAVAVATGAARSVVPFLTEPILPGRLASAGPTSPGPHGPVDKIPVTDGKGDPM